ncbi:MAG: ribonuclease III [Acholeplasmatales bacterium]|nr:ribonuclease III [Acholeplasmatales bacterium]
MDVNTLNGLSLAYIGDAVYEIYIRKHVLDMGYGKVNDLHKHVIRYTSGEGQAAVIHRFLAEEILSEDELNAFKRGRNSHVKSSRKNMELKDYLDATGFEALVGYLYLSEKIERLEELVVKAISIREE